MNQKTDNGKERVYRYLDRTPWSTLQLWKLEFSQKYQFVGILAILVVPNLNGRCSSQCVQGADW